MDAIELLEEQHRDVEDLFEELEEADASDKGEIFAEIADQLALHATIEERHFYPALDQPPTGGLVRESRDEHATVKRLLAELMTLPSSDTQFDGKIAALKEAVEHHVDEEEEELFPRARKLLDKERLAALAEEMSATQDSLLAEGDPRDRILQETGQAPTIE
jgi:hemerythrin-like domain-containing protein